MNLKTIAKMISMAWLLALFLITGNSFAQNEPQHAHNPVIFADVPDMSIIRVGDTWYMSSTTMHMSPGVPIMKSKDLVNWALVSYAYDTLASVDALNLQNGKSAYGKGSWASSLRYHNGTFYMSTFAQTTGATYIFSTKNIEKGPWKVSSFQPAFHDHSLFFDDDGRVYMIYGSGKLKLVELNADVSGVKPGATEQVIIENASAPAGNNIGLPAEGSQLFKINGKYYLFNITWPRGGMRTVVVHRADHITGPYEGRLALQDLGVAQGGLIDRPDGSWYAYLFRDFGAVGRIPYLVPVKWVDGWPVLGNDGKVPETLDLPANKSLIPGIVARDEFTRQKGEPTLPLVWQWNHNPDNRLWSVTKRKGWLRLTTGRVDTSFLLARNTLTQRTIGPGCSGSTLIDVSNMKEGDMAGLSVLQKRYGIVGVQYKHGVKSIVMISAETEKPVEMQSVPLTQDKVYLKIECDFTDRKDIASFFYSLDGSSWTPIGSQLKMAYTIPQFMGYRFGLFNYATQNAGGFVDFDFFHIEDPTYPFQNPHVSSEERAKDLIGRLTLDEKASLMLDQSNAIPRLGIKKFNWWSEALHGLANNGNVTVFPEPVGMAASFDDKLLYQVFDAVSDEVRAKYNEAKQKGAENKRFLSLSVWTPNINIFRDPRWGRGQETYGEDPYLTSRMGVAVVKGLQGPDNYRYKKLLACAKHFAVHSGPEWSRHVINLNLVDPRDLWETYLPAFKSLVTKADVREVMCAYQRLNDEPCCGNNQLLQQILRNDWGFRYMVVSDCGAISDFWQTHKVSSDATHAAAKGVIAGTDVECGYDYAFKRIPDAVKRGLLSEEEINKHLMRLLTGRFDLGEMDDDSLVPWSKIPLSVVNSPQHKQLALDIARETMALLQNKNNILPLSPSIKRIAVVGPNADDKPVLWGNYNGTPFNTITIVDGIKRNLSGGKLIYYKACDRTDQMITESVIGECSIDGKPGIKATYWNNRDFKGPVVTSAQLVDQLKLTTAGQHEFSTGVQLQDFSAIYQTVYRPARSGEMVFKFEACGEMELTVNGALVKRYSRWQSIPTRVPFNVEKGKEYNIEVRFRQVSNWQASLNLNFGWETPVQFDGLIEKLKGIDTVVFAGGLCSQLEGEEMPVDIPGFKGGDRTDIELPAVQRDCLKALKQAGKKIIFVNCSGSAIGLVPETENCDAILQAWYGGESGGQAVADVIFGDYNPCGKLPITFYKNISQLPDFENYSMKGRTYRFMSDPLFPFGFGLSYTTFAIGDATISKTRLHLQDTVVISIPVSNTGKRDGTEVIQLYVHKVNDVDGPLKTLRNFQRVQVAAGKTNQVIISIPVTDLEFYDSTTGKMTTTPGQYELLYGNSSAQKDLKITTVTIE